MVIEEFNLVVEEQGGFGEVEAAGIKLFHCFCWVRLRLPYRRMAF